MSKYHDAAAVLRRHAVKYEALMSAAKALDEVGSLDQAATECQAAAEAAKIEMREAKAQLDSSKADLAEHKEKVKAAKKLDQAKADEIIQSATDDAKSIVDAANLTAAQIKADASDKADTLLNEANAQRAALAVDILHAQADLKEITNQAESKMAEAEDLEKRIAKAQASIAKLLG